jgi:methionyl-tRNA formyltransferase
VAKIVLFGQAKFGADVLSGLLQRDHEITVVSVPPDRPGSATDPLKAAALEAGIRVVQRKSYKSDEALAEVAPGDADLGVLAYVTQIIPLRILDAPQLASICFHPSLLPAYRGGSAINWQIINGERVGGVTLFRPDEGIDTGPIYLQRELEIGPDETAGSYYYGTVFEPGVAATLDAVELVVGGRAKPAGQDEAQASYQPLCRSEHAGVDWSAPTQKVHDLIRGCDPSPGAHSTLQERAVSFFGSRRRTTEAVAAPGTVIGLDDDGLEIATGDGSVTVAKLKVDAAGAGKQAAAAAATAAGIVAGSRFGS